MSRPFLRLTRALSIAGIAVASALPTPAAYAQQRSLADAPVEAPAAVLPDAPGMSLSSAADPDTLAPAPQPGQNAGGGKVFPSTAGRYDTVILPGQTAQRLGVRDKVIFGVRDSISPFSIIGWGVSAGYEQAADASPNYGVPGNTRTGKSFAQRLGAAAARDTSETIIGESILAPILHEDPRYYKQGPGKNLLYRFFYAGTRELFTRTDGGRSTINFQSLGGNLAGSAITQLYYPPGNRSFDEVFKTFGGSIGGSAIGNEVSEFLPGLLETVHLKKRVQ